MASAWLTGRVLAAGLPACVGPGDSDRGSDAVKAGKRTGHKPSAWTWRPASDGAWRDCAEGEPTGRHEALQRLSCYPFRGAAARAGHAGPPVGSCFK